MRQPKAFATISCVFLFSSCGGTLPHEETATRPDLEALDNANNLEGLASIAAGNDADLGRDAQVRLRAHGAAGLDAALEVYAPILARFRSDPLLRRDPEIERVRNAVDAIAAQRDAFASRLYWHTDIESAKAEARRSHRPILSLRLLGRLDEELSCANSRLFRTLLYPDADVSQYLRDHYVLHWSSERPAPVITIDMGDGRMIRRTITGNSVHYVLDETGRPIDALPGLYTPNRFVAELRAAEETAHRCGREDFSSCVLQAHATRQQAARTEWESVRGPALAAIAYEQTRIIDPPAPGGEVPARVAGPVAMGKAIIEVPMLRLLEPAGAEFPLPREYWNSVGESYAEPLDDNARFMVTLKLSGEENATFATLSQTLGEETARNEFVLHRQIRDLFIGGSGATLSELNRRIYEELFLTPASDPWLGLQENEMFDALEE